MSLRTVRFPDQDEGVEAAAKLEAVRDEAPHGVASLRPGQPFDGRFACVRKDRLTARNGSSYLALELRDRSGTLAARVFRDADRIAARFERGDAIHARGRVERFKGALVAEIETATKLEPGSFDPAEFLPVAYRSLEELEGFLEHLAREVHDPGLAVVVKRVLFEGEVAEDFRRAPCSRGGHHAYLGGLLEHTVAVGTLVTEVCQLHPRLDSDLLMAAALLHDVGKAREFTYGAEIEISEAGRLLGHLALGSEIVSAAAHDLPEERRLALLHCILRHHSEGRGTSSPEALALQRINALDAGVKGALEGRTTGH
jgi:3'-5' exoribonuclease